MKSITVQSVFSAGQPIAVRHAEDGRNLSPPLQWAGAPPETREFALIVDDPDAPQPEPWVHWVMYRIPAKVTSLPEGVAPSEHVAEAGGALHGKNSWSRLGYGGPAPPCGHGTHHYHFKVFALDAALALAPAATKRDLLAAMQGHVLAQGELIGTYER